MKLNEKIQYYRKKAGLSQEALAEKLGVSRQAISKWETGDTTPEISNLLLMAGTFGVTTDHLLSEDEPESFEPQTEKENKAECRNSKSKFFDGAAKGLGIIGRIANTFGWLGGVYVAFSGVPFLIVGFVMRYFAKRSFEIFEFVSGTGTGTVVVDSFGKTYSSAAEAMLSDPFIIISSVVIGIGTLAVVLGLILAVYLYKKFKNNT